MRSFLLSCEKKGRLPSKNTRFGKINMMLGMYSQLNFFNRKWTTSIKTHVNRDGDL